MGPHFLNTALDFPYSRMLKTQLLGFVYILFASDIFNPSLSHTSASLSQKPNLRSPSISPISSPHPYPQPPSVQSQSSLSTLRSPISSLTLTLHLSDLNCHSPSFDLRSQASPSPSISSISTLTLHLRSQAVTLTLHLFDLNPHPPSPISSPRPHPHPPSFRSQPSPSIFDLKPSSSPLPSICSISSPHTPPSSHRQRGLVSLSL